MQPIDLKELLSRESERVEWKENVADINDVVRTICAFSNDYANMGGGYVVCGAAEEKDEYGFLRVRLAGVTSARLREIEGKVMTACRDYIDPPVVPTMQELPAEDPSRRVLVFVVPATTMAHCFRAAKEGSPSYYIRMGRETVLARNGLYRELLVRKGAAEPWDRRMAATATVEDLDLIVLREYLNRMGVLPSRNIDDLLSDTAAISPFAAPLLARESLTNRLRPRNFAVLLFGKHPERTAPGAYTIVSNYAGVDRAADLSSRQELTGPILMQAEKAVELLSPELETIFDKTGPQPNLTKYPRRALLEAIVNAIVHRDYQSDQPVRITVFRNRVEILSPGSLPSAVPREKFVVGQASPYWRNQNLAFFFSKLQLAQAEGQGILTILRTMREQGCPDPIFEVEPERVITTLPAHPRHELLRRVLDAESAVFRGDFDKAVELIRASLAADPYLPLAWELFAISCRAAGRLEEFHREFAERVAEPEKLPRETLAMIGLPFSPAPERTPQKKEP